MNSLNLPEFLKYGIIGFGAILALLSFYLLNTEQKKTEPNGAILRSIYFYMLFSIALLCLGFASENSEKSNTKVEFHSGFSKDALNGIFDVQGNDIDFPAENFKTPRHKYKGTMEIKEEGNQIIIEGILGTYDAKTDTLKGSKTAKFKSIGTINNNYVAGQYFYGTEKVNGFGTMMLKFSNSAKEGKMYCVFRTTSGSADIGMAEMKLIRK